MKNTSWLVISLVLVALLYREVAAREPQKIKSTYESYIPEGWVAWDQFGTHGMGDTREEAIEDCRKTYKSKLQKLGVDMSKSCKCKGMFRNETPSMWCEVHATKENLTDAQRTEIIAELERVKLHIEKRLKSLKD